MLFQPVLQPLHAIGDPLLLAREAPHGVLASLALSGLRDLGGHLALRVRKLAALELHVAERAPPIVTAGPRLKLFLEIAQLVERAAAAGVRGVLTPQLAGCRAHLVGDLAHPIRCFSAARPSA